MKFHDYLNNQKTEDRRAFIVHYPAKSGKTQFAREICEQREDAHLLDLQAYFLQHPELSPIRRLDFTKFKDLLLSLDMREDVILVDNVDFLFNTWRKKDKEKFSNWLKHQLRTPGDTKKTFIFVFQTDPFIENIILVNSNQESRVLPMNEFESI